MTDVIQFQIYNNMEEEEQEENDPDDIMNGVTRGTSENSTQQCSICLNQINNGSEIGTLVCGHTYHYSCIERWLNTNQSCPTCRRRTRPERRRTQTNTAQNTTGSFSRLINTRNFMSNVMSQLDNVNIIFDFRSGPAHTRLVKTTWKIHDKIVDLLDFVSKFHQVQDDFFIQIEDNVFKYSESSSVLSREIVYYISTRDVTISVYTIN